MAPGASRGLGAPRVTADAALAVGLPMEGDLGAESTLRLFALAASTGASGRLTLAPEGSAYSLTFRKGVLEHVTTSSPDDGLPGYLVHRGVVRPEQMDEAVAAAGPGGDLVGVLVTRKLVNGADLVRLIQEHGAQLVTRALGVEAGRWRWEPGVAPPPSAFPMGSPWVMLGAAVRAFDAAAVVRRLGPREQLGASQIAGRVRVEDLRLGPAEARAAAAFDGTRLSDLARLRGADATMVLRVALLLAEVELLSFGPPRVRTAAPTPQPPVPAATAPVPSAPARPPPPVAAAPPPGPPPAPAPPVAAPTPATPRPPAAAPRTPPPAPRPAAAPPARAAPVADEASLQALLASYADADHFKVLGVAPDASAAQIKIAYFQLAKAYHPDTVAVNASPAVKKLCADLFSRIGEAWGSSATTPSAPSTPMTSGPAPVSPSTSWGSSRPRRSSRTARCW